MKPKASKPDPAAKHRDWRMNRVEEMLNEDRSLHIATMTDADSAPGIVILTVARRGMAVFEMEIPAGRYDPFELMDLIARRYGGLPKQ